MRTSLIPGCGILASQMYLTLPLPVSKTVSVNVVLVQADGSAPPLQCAVDVPKTGTFKHLYQAIAKVPSLTL